MYYLANVRNLLEGAMNANGGKNEAVYKLFILNILDDKIDCDC